MSISMIDCHRIPNSYNWMKDVMKILKFAFERNVPEADCEWYGIGMLSFLTRKIQFRMKWKQIFLNRFLKFLIYLFQIIGLVFIEYNSKILECYQRVIQLLENFILNWRWKISILIRASEKKGSKNFNYSTLNLGSKRHVL